MSKVATLILGLGGMSRELRDLMRLSSSHEFKGFLDDFSKVADVLGPIASHQTRSEKLCCGISSYQNMGKRKSLLEKIPMDRFVGFKAKESLIYHSAQAHESLIVFPFSAVSADVQIGKHVIIYHHVIISHDCQIGDYSIVSNSATLSGGVKVGQNCYIGAGAIIREGVKIGDNSLVAAGALILNDVPPGVIYISESTQRPNPHSF